MLDTKQQKWQENIFGNSLQWLWNCTKYELFFIIQLKIILLGRPAPKIIIKQGHHIFWKLVDSVKIRFNIIYGFIQQFCKYDNFNRDIFVWAYRMLGDKFRLFSELFSKIHNKSSSFLPIVRIFLLYLEQKIWAREQREEKAQSHQKENKFWCFWKNC